ncbi:MAG: hypothetical protein PF590_06540 [Candidatus Delongbacteria bacterium]|nr:hypothetical protein [Candidatus Delongbacteria bacterium]
MALFGLYSMNVYARDLQDTVSDNKENYFIHGVGGVWGNTTGKGLAYRHRVNDFSVQLAFMPIVRDMKYDFEITTGLTFMYKLSDAKYVDLFVYQANQHRYLTESSWNCSPGEICPSVVPWWPVEKKHYYEASIGFGFDFLLWNRLSLNLMLGYAAKENFTKYLIEPGAGLFFKF